MCINIDINNFLEKFNKEYEFLYENHDNVVGYYDALIEGNEFIENYPEFVGEFVKYRGDFISSDREVVAFMFVLSDIVDQISVENNIVK